ncbi:MAG: hypothetical protein PHS73_04715 [Candidatus Peribacteraceae bacterium]|nr:hypothetical protein [Candidatus Peribacteraceae bacterium]
MPLKHTTETFLIFLFGVVILLTGFLLSTLPDLPVGAVPWAILFVLALLYPLSLVFLFRSRRADHAFRLLHWFPALMLLVWLGLQIVALERTHLLSLVDGYTWAWTLPAVALAFILLVTYCLRVVRRAALRIVLLLIAFLPFVTVALVSERGPHWERQMASALWEGQWLKSMEGATLLGFTINRRLPLAQNLSSSNDASEESWRERLRAAEQRRREVRERMLRSTGAVLPSPSSVSSSSAAVIAEVESKPAKLPSSGPEIGFLVLCALAGYAGVLHDRARRRG